ncbi:hypothetical protein ACFLZP_00465 [Patescibacteria group bacterium]
MPDNSKTDSPKDPVAISQANPVALAQKPLTPPLEELVQTYYQASLADKVTPEIGTIHVDEIASKVAFFYEKVRKIVDWKEEHLVRRGAIERILKRRMISELSGISLVKNLDPHKIAEPLVIELIRGGHFTNGKIPRSKVMEVQKVLEKYIFILDNNPTAKKGKIVVKKKINLYTWILEIAACEIEETLEPPIRENALILCMLQLMNERIKVLPQGTIPEAEKQTQIYIAIHRSLFNLDSPIISYHLIKNRWPNWGNLNQPELQTISNDIFQIIIDVDKNLTHPLGGKFYNLCEKYDTIYLLLGDALKKLGRKPQKMLPVFQNPKQLLAQVKKAYLKRLKTLKKRLIRAAIYSTLSIFLAGGFSLYIFEIPLAKLVYGEWKLLAIVVDILLPTALMALLVAFVRPPKKGNLKRVLAETRKVVYPQKKIDVYEIRTTRKIGPILKIFVGLLYLAGTVASLGLVFWVFSLAKVPLTSLYVDTLNVAMIVFAALVIKQRAQELTVEAKPGFWDFILDILSVPMGKIGQWLSNKWKEYNVVSVFFIALVDMPFSTFIGFIDNWSSFIKEKKAEITQ